jgi:uncharacterized protein (DUF362 family)
MRQRFEQTTMSYDDTNAPALDRRDLLVGSVAAAAVLSTVSAEAAPVSKEPPSYAAMPPAGFTPFSAPGRVVKITGGETLQANKLFPKPESAKAMLEKALTELTGKSSLVEALKFFVHPQDKVVVKVNGIALKSMSTNKELIMPLLEGILASGVPANQLTVLEQYMGFLNGTRLNTQNVPPGVKVEIHANNDSKMEPRMVTGTGVRTRFCRTLLECTAVINVHLVKDHSICGYTGALKNMTHGTTLNPQDFHVHHASPQIALLYAQDAIKSRVRLNIADAFKVMYDGGPLYKKPEHVVPYEAVLASTDPVAIDAIGWEIVEEHRKRSKMRSLTDEGRAPAYIKGAADLGLGIADRSKIELHEAKV